MRWSDMDRCSWIIGNEMRWNAKKCNEIWKCAMKHENAQEHALSASVGKHRTYGALHRNVLHDIPMEVQVIMRMINGLLVWICPLRTHRNMSPYSELVKGYCQHSITNWPIQTSSVFKLDLRQDYPSLSEYHQYSSWGHPSNPPTWISSVFKSDLQQGHPSNQLIQTSSVFKLDWWWGHPSNQPNWTSLVFKLY